MKETLLAKASLFLIWVLTYFSPTGYVLMVVGFFVMCDTLTGVLAAKREGQSITSKKLGTTISKFIAYMVGVLCGHVFQQVFFPEFPALKLIGGFIAMIELKSIDENIKRITGYSLLKTATERLESLRSKNTNT